MSTDTMIFKLQIIAADRRLFSTQINPVISWGFYYGRAIGSLTWLRLFGFLDILNNMPSSPLLRAPCIHALLRALATKEKQKPDTIGQK